jgi:hypothetical protein
MQIHRALLVFCFSAMLCRAQATNTDQALLREAREKYDAPFDRNLQSFHCAVDFSWKEHFTEAPRAGDEGTDEEIEKFIQPLHNHVIVTRQMAALSALLSNKELNKLPHHGMAVGLLAHAVEKSLNIWLLAGMNIMLPNPGTPVSFDQSPSGYKLTVKVENSDGEMVLGPDMRLQSASVKGGQPDHIETSFAPGPQGFLLTSFTQGEEGKFEPGNRLIFTYTYQTVDGVQLPERVVLTRESHHEVWRYRLTDCIVATGK